jgi:hypothetical protein
MLDGLLDQPNAPWDVWNFSPRVHPILFVHRIEGLDPGVYALPRRPAAAEALRAQMRGDFEWQSPENVPAHLPFYVARPGMSGVLFTTEGGNWWGRRPVGPRRILAAPFFKLPSSLPQAVILCGSSFPHNAGISAAGTGGLNR